MSVQKEIYVQMDRCVGCHTCELACAVEHSSKKELFAALFETPRPRKRLFVEAVEEYRIPVLCRHCEDAPCVSVCPTGATFQDEEKALVLHEAKKCIGCLLCVQACPFGMMSRRAESRIAVKCDRCPDRNIPACVESCPTNALMITETEAFGRTRRKAVVESLVHTYIVKDT